MEERRKPLGMKNYGHIAHLPGSRMGPGDHSCELGQARIATLKARDRHDQIIVQEKLDGTNVGVARLKGVLYPLVRAGYVADTSPFEQHWRFAQWVYANQDRFLAVLRDGERLVVPARTEIASGRLISSSSMFVLTRKMVFTCRRLVAESQFGIGAERRRTLAISGRRLWPEQSPITEKKKKQER